MQEIGKYVIIAGILIVFVGVLLYFFHDKLSWFGNLPGDIKSEGENFKFFMPITSMIIISVVLSLLLWFFKGK